MEHPKGGQNISRAKTKPYNLEYKPNHSLNTLPTKSNSNLAKLIFAQEITSK
jgi:hypothetical protein